MDNEELARAIKKLNELSQQIIQLLAERID